MKSVTNLWPGLANKSASHTIMVMQFVSPVDCLLFNHINFIKYVSCSSATGDYWLPGANVVGLATASINRSAELTWKELDFTISLQCLIKCHITVAAGFSSGFTFPSDATLVSAVYYIELSEEPAVPATVEFDHLNLLNSSSESMKFGLARKKQPSFRLFPGDFTSKKLHGRFRLPKSPLLLAAFCYQCSSEIKYSAYVFCEHEGPTLWKLIVVTVPRLTAYAQVSDSLMQTCITLHLDTRSCVA